MYASEKYVRTEIKELKKLIDDLGRELGEDIKFLHHENQQLKQQIEMLLGKESYE